MSEKQEDAALTGEKGSGKRVQLPCAWGRGRPL